MMPMSEYFGDYFFNIYKFHFSYLKNKKVKLISSGEINDYIKEHDIKGVTTAQINEYLKNYNLRILFSSDLEEYLINLTDSYVYKKYYSLYSSWFDYKFNQSQPDRTSQLVRERNNLLREYKTKVIKGFVTGGVKK